MKINQKTRVKYELDQAVFSVVGNLKFEGDIHEVRQFVQKIKLSVDRTKENYQSIINKYLPERIVHKFDDFFERQTELYRI